MPPGHIRYPLVISSNIINDYNLELSYDNELLIKLINHIFISEKIRKASISIILTNQNYLSKLKKEYFNVDQFTDVIAFNFEEENLEGEIYISIDDVLENAKKYSVSFNDEFKRVLIHGVLHLLGYDDKTKNEIKNMRNLEEKYLSNNSEIIINLK